MPRHEPAGYYGSSTSAGYYPPSTASPHTPYAPSYGAVAHSYAYAPSHPPTYAHTPPTAYALYERPYSRHSVHSQSSHSLSPELPTSLGVTGMKRKRSDEIVMEPMERERELRGRYPYSDTRETYEPVPPPPRLTPSHPHPPHLPPMRVRSPVQTFVDHSPHERPAQMHYYTRTPQNHYPIPHATPPTTHTSPAGEYVHRQSYGYPQPPASHSHAYPPPPVPDSYAYPQTRSPYNGPPAERVSPHADPHYAQQAAAYPPYRSPTSAYNFAPSRHSQPPYDSRPTSGNREPIIATPYAVPRTETSPVVEMVQRVEEERRAHSRETWGSRGMAYIVEDAKPGSAEGEVVEPSGVNEPADVAERQNDHAMPTPTPTPMPMPEKTTVNNIPALVASGATPSDEARQMEREMEPQVNVETVAATVVDTSVPDQMLAPALSEEAKPAMTEPVEDVPKPQLVVEVDIKPEPVADMDIDVVSDSPAATISVAYPTPIEGYLQAVERSPSLASTVPLAPEVVEPSPAPTIRRASTLPDGEQSPAATVLRVEPSPAPTVPHESTKEEPASPVLNVDAVSPQISTAIRQTSGAPRADGNEVQVPESTQLSNLVDAAFRPVVKSETPATASRADVDVDVVDVPAETPEAGRGGSILSETTNAAADKIGAVKSKSSKTKTKSHKASAVPSKNDHKAKSKAKEAAKSAVAKDKDAAKVRENDASAVPANKSKSKKSHSKQVARVRTPESAETPEPAKGEDEEDKEKDDRLYCMCETLYDEERFMIGCDKCDNWYHPACVGLEEDAADLIDKFYCPRCIASDTSLSTTHKRPCARFPSCTNPSRLPSSKYCSDECGQARVEEIYNMQPKAVQELIKKAVQGAKRPEGRVDPVTGRVHGRGKGEDAQLGMLEESLQEVLEERAESERRLEMWERRERVVEAIANRWKHELKEEGICGYDERLGYGWDELDNVDPSEPGEVVCQEGLKCDRHRGWQQAHTEGVQRAKALEEENLQDLTLRERGLRREMEIIEARRQVVQRTWRKVADTVPVTALAESAGLTNEVPEVIDVKFEV
ncbi:hypothetical protein CALVIDRAFT_540154 [Calocera viscosa TUFC12733]|uniref:PHD-type domain-containing protein n=1 Tax=Calocera viscosa (strain TUFC12733) TaxID=1330018 RepID=A0A167J225_CALVF|nr:hypothetical protein CALVIDRAFT_540154 [Calocera viscosa TUFC12733]